MAAATDTAAHDGAAAPFDLKNCPELPAANCTVVPAADWYGIVPALPPARLLAVVAVVAVVAREVVRVGPDNTVP